jgi:hypothetical protein
MVRGLLYYIIYIVMDAFFTGAGFLVDLEETLLLDHEKQLTKVVS